MRDSTLVFIISMALVSKVFAQGFPDGRYWTGDYLEKFLHTYDSLYSYNKSLGGKIHKPYQDEQLIFSTNNRKKELYKQAYDATRRMQHDSLFFGNLNVRHSLAILGSEAIISGHIAKIENKLDNGLDRLFLSRTSIVVDSVIYSEYTQLNAGDTLLVFSFEGYLTSRGIEVMPYYQDFSLINRRNNIFFLSNSTYVYFVHKAQKKYDELNADYFCDLAETIYKIDGEFFNENQETINKLIRIYK